MTGECFNCGETGCVTPVLSPPHHHRLRLTQLHRHNKADCTNPRVERPFTGTCRICNQEGHPARECPQKPPTVCKNCREEGHVTSECKNPRKLDFGVPKMNDEEAWELLKKADTERDLDEFKTAVKVYAQAVPAVDFAELEHTLRSEEMNVHLIALVSLADAGNLHRAEPSLTLNLPHRKGRSRTP